MENYQQGIGSNMQNQFVGMNSQISSNGIISSQQDTLQNIPNLSRKSSNSSLINAPIFLQRSGSHSQLVIGQSIK